jgi:hypothetical protein
MIPVSGKMKEKKTISNLKGYSMTDRIIGFTISRDEIDHKNVDVFNSGIAVREIKTSGLILYLFGFGNPERCVVNGKYCLSFPLNDGLLDRNVTIYHANENFIVENDWLGSIPVFYNSKDVTVSTLCLKTLRDKKLDMEGMSNYFEFGYSVFENTAFENVKFMRFFSRLIVNKTGITIEYKDDPVLKAGLLEEAIDEDQVICKLKKYVNDVERMTEDEIILPTSGGYDSRMLNILVDDKTRIRSYTYGISRNQSESFEVVYAKKISEILGTKWRQIPLGNFNDYMDEWFEIYGFSTHLHGMYHIEFYKNMIMDEFGKNATFLSGIFGDIWARYPKIKPIKNLKGMKKLGYTHGLSVDKKQIDIRSGDYSMKNFFRSNRKFLETPELYPVYLIRIKIILISYLVQIPQFFGFPVWTPYLNFDIAMSILRIPVKRRINRVWQEDFFRKNNMDLDSLNLKTDNSNFLDNDSFDNFNYEKIDDKLMSRLIKASYLKKIDRELSGTERKNRFIKTIYSFDIRNKKNKLLNNKITRYICYKIMLGNKGYDINEYYKNIRIPLLNSYYVIKTIEKALKYES